jgi:serine/threonine-protein kinase
MRNIGKYEIVGLLGIGGMGRVYAVRMPVAGRVVALKLLAPREELVMLWSEEEVERRFLSEVAILGRIDHPHVAKVLDVDRDERGRPFYCMDYCCVNLGVLLGETYESEHPTRSLDVDTAVRYGRQVLSGLERLHAEGIVHLDVKPFNALVDVSDDVKLIDFGLSKVRGERFTRPTGLKIGTPFYAAPEQEDDPESADSRADLYGAGVLLWRMLTGRLPAERADEYQPPSRFNPALDSEWDEFLKKTVEPDPDHRFADAKSMDLALADVHAAWQRRLALTCGLDDVLAAEGAGTASMTEAPRSEPQKVRPGQAQDVFGMDELLRPAKYAEPNFSPQGDTVLHKATGLMLQQAGSAFALSWDEAANYVAELNRENFAGHADWRLPTVDELLTILQPAKNLEDYCLPPVFDHAQRWVWSADTKSFRAAWYVDARLGFTAFQDITCAFHVRAVRGP